MSKYKYEHLKKADNWTPELTHAYRLGMVAGFIVGFIIGAILL